MDKRQSDEYVRMSFGNLANKVLALGPLFLVCLICLLSRLYVDPYDPVYQTSEQEAAIDAYIEPVRLTDEATITIAHPEVVRQIAQVWIGGAKSGKLKPLLPCATDDTLRGPIKSQIYLANQKVAEELIRLSRIELSKGQYTQAAHDSVLSLKCSEVLKYSDPIAMFVLSDKEDFSLNFLASLGPRLSASDKAWVRSQLVALKNSQQPLDEMYRIVKYNAERDEQREQANETATYDPQLAEAVGFEVDTTPYSAAVDQLRRGAKRILITPYLQQTGLAYKSQSRMMGLLKRAIESVKAGEPEKAI